MQYQFKWKLIFLVLTHFGRKSSKLTDIKFSRVSSCNLNYYASVDFLNRPVESPWVGALAAPSCWLTIHQLLHWLPTFTLRVPRLSSFAAAAVFILAVTVLSWLPFFLFFFASFRFPLYTPAGPMTGRKDGSSGGWRATGDTKNATKVSRSRLLMTTLYKPIFKRYHILTGNYIPVYLLEQNVNPGGRLEKFTHLNLMWSKTWSIPSW